MLTNIFFFKTRRFKIIVIIDFLYAIYEQTFKNTIPLEFFVLLDIGNTLYHATQQKYSIFKLYIRFPTYSHKK